MSNGSRDRRPRAETDQLILAYLETHPYVSTARVGDAVRISKNAAQKHLYRLERGGRVVSEEKPNYYTGRPGKTYALAPGTNAMPTQEDLCQ